MCKRAQDLSPEVRCTQLLMPREGETMLSSNLVRPGAKNLGKDGDVKRKLAPVVLPGKQGPHRREINLLLSVEDNMGGKGYRSETINVMAGETIRNLKIRLRNHGFFTKNHCLVFGERAVMENETVGQVVTEETPLMDWYLLAISFASLDAHENM